MRKIISVLAGLFFCLNLFSQSEMDSLSMQFQAMMKNTTYGKNKNAGKFYNIRGFKMYTETYGTGQPLLIIHGNGGSINNFLYQIPYFSSKYKVIIADSRAQGNSKDESDSLSYEMMADDYAALLDQMKIDSAYVIGWSDGGINGLLLAIRHPEKVKKLAVTGANLWPDTTAVFNDVEQMVLPEYNSAKAMTSRTPQQKAGWKLLRLLVEEPQIPLADLHKISIPTLVIGGDHDVIKPEHTLLIAQNIPNSYLWILPNSGHSTPIIYKDDFNKQIDDFFSKPFRKIDGVKRFF
ncbi:MAG TPA: alpha/beta hydrolase [Flavisolibacter sp.]|jgi:pimeloyl-ACP methyl ester carboxylesterase|nr:alpha/beta hydrolase [Flavisolibacter sp.]